MSVFAPSVTLPPAAPPPERLPIVSLFARLSVAPATFAMLTCEASEMALPPDAVSIPALMLVAPV